MTLLQCTAFKLHTCTYLTETCSEVRKSILFFRWIFSSVQEQEELCQPDLSQTRFFIWGRVAFLCHCSWQRARWSCEASSCQSKSSKALWGSNFEALLAIFVGQREHSRYHICIRRCSRSSAVCWIPSSAVCSSNDCLGHKTTACLLSEPWPTNTYHGQTYLIGAEC